MIEVSARQSFVGADRTIASEMERFVTERRLRRVHPRATRHARRSGPVRRQGRSPPAGARGVPGRIRGRDVARPPWACAHRTGTERLSMTETPIPLSVLDLVPVASGQSPADAVRNSIDLARQAERLGYRRYWFAEHHLNPGVAGTAPAIMTGLVANADDDDPGRLGRRADGPSHALVRRGGVRHPRRRLPGTPRPRARPDGGDSATPPGRGAKKPSAGRRAPGAAPPARSAAAHPSPPSLARPAILPVAVARELLQQPEALTPDYTSRSVTSWRS